MSNENGLKIFESNEFGSVRVVEKDGEPWFVANDVAGILGYADPKKAIRVHCKCAELLKGAISSSFTSSPRGIAIIPERDVYRLILRSKLPAAEQFEEWVVGEVLPSVRKKGYYGSQLEMVKDLIGNPDFGIKMLTTIKEQNEKIAVLEKGKKEADILTSTLMHTDRLYTATNLAKELGYRSATTFNRALHTRGIQYKSNGVWTLYAQYAGKGYVETKQGVSADGNEFYYTKWTQKGRLFLLNLLGQKSVAEIAHDLPMEYSTVVQ